MDANEQITKFKELIESAYLGQLNENIRKEKNYVVVDFADLSKFDPELADLLLDQPEEVIRAAELGIVQLDLPEKQIKVRFANLPDSQKLLIRNIRSKHLGKMYLFEGVVRQKSDVRPQVTSAKFECPSCGNVINVLQVDQKMREGEAGIQMKKEVDAGRLEVGVPGE